MYEPLVNSTHQMDLEELTNSAMKVHSSMSNQRNKYYILWLLTGLVWGIVTQLAMIGTILLTIKYKVSTNRWFEEMIVLMFTLLNLGGPFAVSHIYLHMSTTNTMLNSDKMEPKERSQTMNSFVLFSLIGSSVSCHRCLKDWIITDFQITSNTISS